MQISSLLMCLVATAGLAACGGDGDGNKPKVDAPMAEIDAPPAAMLTCDAYCSRIMQNCTDTNQQYGSMAQCMTSCAHLTPGALTDMGPQNTLGCRIYHAGAAMTGPGVHCIHAGPSGDGVCGNKCESFCKLVLGSCTGANQQYNGDMNMCMTACAGYATTPPYNSSQTGGNTFACRLYHATVASSSPMMHCPHTAAVTVGGPCS
jgi:hypothetical protein